MVYEQRLSCQLRLLWRLSRWLPAPGEDAFPDKQRPLHLFSGKVDQAAFPGDTVDINPT